MGPFRDRPPLPPEPASPYGLRRLRRQRRNCQVAIESPRTTHRTSDRTKTNRLLSRPPLALSIADLAADNREAKQQRWITPDLAHEVADDLLRTKFVVPFVDGVVSVSELISKAITDCGLRHFRRFHAKDSGYHARHFYVLLPVPGYTGEDVDIALEIKVLTKTQDVLGELTHLLYEKHRTGEMPIEKKRKLAWQFDSPDFLATYVGHSAHFLEASVLNLKNQIFDLDESPNGQS